MTNEGLLRRVAQLALRLSGDDLAMLIGSLQMHQIASDTSAPNKSLERNPTTQTACGCFRIAGLFWNSDYVNHKEGCPNTPSE